MGTLWEVPREWEGEAAVIMASGPSMSAEVARAVRGRARTIVVNDNFKLAPWADVLYAADAGWWHESHRLAQCEKDDPLLFKGRKVSIVTITGMTCHYPEVLCLRKGGDVGIDLRPGYLRTCMNGGHQAINLAVNFGAKTILLCGFDMREVDGKEHWFGSHPEKIRARPGIPFGDFVKHMTRSAPDLKSTGVRVINCTKDSALKCFEYMDLEKALESVSSNTRDALLPA